MTLTKKHFTAIAEIINFKVNLHKYNKPNKVLVLSELVEDLSRYFKTENPLFNEEKFKKECLK